MQGTPGLPAHFSTILRKGPRQALPEGGETMFLYL